MKRTAGRPSMGVFRTTIKLSPKHKELAETIGEGCMVDGLRKALEAYPAICKSNKEVRLHKK